MTAKGGSVMGQWFVAALHADRLGGGGSFGQSRRRTPKVLGQPAFGGLRDFRVIWNLNPHPLLRGKTQRVRHPERRVMRLSVSELFFARRERRQLRISSLRWW